MTRSMLAMSGLALSLACGGLAPAPAHDNVSACRAYVARFNAFPCTRAALDAADYCPDALDRSSCDMEPWYECIATAARCDGDVMDLAGQARCTVPDCANPFQENLP